MTNKKAFTLIELIAVLVILAILALIVTPLVLNIIKKARTAADKRSIDAYGKSVELAIADYLLDKGEFPTSIEELTIEYSGDKVECSQAQIKSDSTVYLAGCTVGGREVKDYTYGSEETVTYEAYKVGDEVTYNNVDYYVIEDSDSTNNTVKLLKENPLLKTEMDALNLTDVTIEEENSYGKVQYGSSTDYNSSTVKKVVDAWASSAVKSGDIATARLITVNDIDIERKEFDCCGGCGQCISTKDFVKYDWLYNSAYWYWTMSQLENSFDIQFIDRDGYLNVNTLSSYFMVRPVLELHKSDDIIKETN